MGVHSWPVSDPRTDTELGRDASGHRSSSDAGVRLAALERRNFSFPRPREWESPALTKFRQCRGQPADEEIAYGDPVPLVVARHRHVALSTANQDRGSLKRGQVRLTCFAQVADPSRRPLPILSRSPAS